MISDEVVAILPKYQLTYPETYEIELIPHRIRFSYTRRRAQNNIVFFFFRTHEGECYVHKNSFKDLPRGK